MGLFKKSNKGSEATRTSQQPTPSRPPRSRIHSDTYNKYQQAFEQAREEELRKLDEQAEKDRRNRTGSVIFRLTNAVQNSTKTMGFGSHNGQDAPIEMPKELSEILRSPLLRNAFRIYLKRMFASESLAFFETIEMFKKVPVDEWRAQMAEGMLERFVNEEAEFAVNISSADKYELIARKRTNFWPPESFDAVQREMYALMSTNYFSSFCKTYWPGGVLLAIPGGPFSYENLQQRERLAGSTASFDELGSNSTNASGSEVREHA